MLVLIDGDKMKTYENNLGYDKASRSKIHTAT